MTFLKKLGTILLKGTQIITGLQPLLPGYANQVSRVKDTLEEVSSIIINMEAIGAVLGTSGPDKLKAVQPLVTQVVLRSDMLTGKKIDNQILFASGISKVTDGIVEILNSIKDDVETENVN